MSPPSGTRSSAGGVRAGWVHGAGIPGGYQEGYIGYPALRQRCSRRGQDTAERAPEGPAGPGVGGILSSDVPAAGRSSPPCGPGRFPPRGTLPGMTSECRLLANKARFQDILLKVSQNGEVSTLFRQKACHSPCFQKRSRNSPLEILRFPYPVAFSHKELMGRFDPHSRVYCQNDEVSPVCTPMYPTPVTRSERQIPPLITPASWLL